MKIVDFLSETKVFFYDFSQCPNLLFLKKNDMIEKKLSVVDASKTEQWFKLQKSFIKWTQDKDVFTENYVKSGYSLYNDFFNNRGCFKGNVLDIGGGWGLLREWWINSPDSFYFVHDPGVERFLAGPHPTHRKIFTNAFLRSMIFVEGFGEELPYKDNIFDQCIIASTLDHVIFPDKVIKECYRCLKDGSSLLVVQSVELAEASYSSSFITNIRVLLSTLFSIHPPDPHINKFTLSELTDLLKNAGFTDISIMDLSKSNSLYAIEAKK
jgi:ubiquinone/menaquinone biosynthesis C-methylase UbiE